MVNSDLNACRQNRAAVAFQERHQLMKKSRKSKIGGWVSMGVLLGLGSASIYLKPFVPKERFSKEKATAGELRRVGYALKRYRAIAGHYPSAEQGLRVLVEAPAIAPHPKRWEQILLDVPKDSWGKEIRYAATKGLK